MENYIVIGDIHGRYDLLDDLLLQLSLKGMFQVFDRSPGAYKLVFLGDMIDRGPQSFEVVERVKWLCDAGKAIALLGNHDQFALDYYHNGIFNKQDIWFYGSNGGQKTVDSYTKHYAMYGAGHFFKAFNQSGHVAWLKSLPYFYETDKVWFSHAPVPRNWKVRPSGRVNSDFRADKDLLLWTVNHDDAEGMWEFDHGKLAVCGHIHALHRWDRTGDDKWLTPRIYPHIVYADTGSGCSYAGRLSAIIITGGKYERYVQASPMAKKVGDIVTDKVL